MCLYMRTDMFICAHLLNFYMPLTQYCGYIIM